MRSRGSSLLLLVVAAGVLACEESPVGPETVGAGAAPPVASASGAQTERVVTVLGVFGEEFVPCADEVTVRGSRSRVRWS